MMQTKTKSTGESLHSIKQSNSESEPRVWTACILALSATCAVFAYRAAWANYFTGDDFVYISWLRAAWLDHNRLWSVFWSNSLDAITTHFYRPLLSLSMALDKYIWGSNAIGFHATNLFFHAACSVILYLIVRDLLLPQLTTANNRSLKLWPSLAAGLFLLYPLHPEVVTWIGGRVDTVVTAFFLATLHCFGRWRQTDKVNWLNWSIVSMVLGLCSKEPAIMLPPTLVAYDYFSQISNKPQTQESQIVAPIKSSFSSTKSFWLVLGLYFIVRRISLGTFVGGYDNNLSVGNDLRLWCEHWLDSIAIMLVPINQLLLEGSKNLWLVFWTAFIFALLASLCTAYLKVRELRPQINFLFAVTVLTLVPVYKVMAICTELESSRLAYLATVPLCCLLALACCTLPIRKFKLTATVCTGAALLVSSALFLQLNNVAWKRAGKASNSIQETIRTLVANGETRSIMFGLPDTIDGAYVCRNALGTMSEEKLKVTSLPPFEHIGCAGLTKDAVIDANPSTLLAWRNEGFQLKPVSLPLKSITLPIEVAGSKLNTVFEPETLAAKGGEPEPAMVKNRLVNIKLPVRRSSIDAIILTVDVEKSSKSLRARDLQIFYPNSIFGTSVVPGCNAHLAGSNAAGREIAFAMRGHANWFFDGADEDMIFMSSGNKDSVFIKSICFVPITDLAPIISCTDAPSKLNLQQPNPNQVLGLVDLTQAKPGTTIHIDASKMQNAKKIRLELSRPNIYFDFPNSAEPNDWCFPTKIDVAGTIADVNVKREMLKPGLCTVRAWALDAQGKAIGLSSDHLYVKPDL
jgi:hypothetical protein